MPLNRRDVLKIFLMSPLFGIAGKLRASAMDTPVSGFLNILLNGLFFMELDNSDSTKPKLVISAPNLKNHVFLAGTRRNLQLTTGFDWTDPSFGLQYTIPSFRTSTPPDPIPTDINNSILKFSKDETGVGPLKAFPDVNLYLGRVILPWPNAFIPLRLGNFPNFDLTKPHVAQKIINRCGGNKIGSAICLQYKFNFSGPVLPTANPTMNFHLHLASCNANDHINDALADASRIFTNQTFDLLIQSAVGAIKPDPIPPALGVTPEDESAALEDEIDLSPFCPPPSPAPISSPKAKPASNKSQAPQASPDGSGVVVATAVSPANCPAFFVG